MIREPNIAWMGLNTSKAFRTCSGAIVLLSSLLQTSLDSDETRFINSAEAKIRRVRF